ncbi:MAG: HAMP domain-containing sensor histidine kinase [Pelobium sp.]
MDNVNKKFSTNSAIKIISYLTGKSAGVKLEGQIFHAMCLFAFLALIITIPINYWLGLQELVLALFILMSLVAFLYYLSRFKQQLLIATGIFQLSIMVVSILHYFYNNGINGPFYGIFALSFFITVAILPKKKYPLWLTLNILTLFICLYIDYAHPHLIMHNYDSPEKKFFDHGLSYIIVMTLFFFVISTIRGAYNRQLVLLAKKADDLDKSNQTKNKLISILAHDLREPLNSIQSYLELITEVGLSEEEKISLELDLLKRTKQTSYMLADMLVWTKNQLAEAKPELVSLQLKETLFPTVKLLSDIAKDKGITIEIQLEDGICVVADRDMLQLVVRNLLMNAIKFTYTGGLIKVSNTIYDEKCIITVKDNGAGIAAELQQQLFSLEVKPSYGTGKEKGMGLGLVLCKEYMELQHGDISFESKQGAGSQFSISLPLCKKTEEAIATAIHKPMGNFMLV